MNNELIRRNWDALFGALVISFDLILYNIAFFSAFWLRWSSFNGFTFQYVELLIVTNVFFLIVGSISGLYRSISKGTLEIQKASMRRFTYFLALFIMSYLYLIKGHIISRGVVVIFIMTQYFFLDAFHVLIIKLKNYLSLKGIGSKATIIVGADKSAVNFYFDLKKNFRSNYNILGFLKNGRPKHPPKEIADKILGAYEDIDKLLQKNHVDRVFIISDSMMQSKYEPIREACEKNRIKLKMISPQTRSLINIAHVQDITGVPLTTDKHRRYINFFKRCIKRCIDMAFSFTVIVVLSPILLLIGILIKLTSKGQVIFKQQRSSFRSGKIFNFYKFRTMYIDADEQKEKLAHLNETNGALFKIKDDPRITTVGKFLRRYSLDEFPQLFNVLKGDMSIVGPRPLPIADFDQIENGSSNYDWYTKRGEIKPGITGLWQISGRSNLTFEDMVMLDLYYIENQSLLFDLEIMFETLPIILTAKGAY